MGAQIDIKQIAPDGAAPGQALVFNGTNWVPGTPPVGLIDDSNVDPASPYNLAKLLTLITTTQPFTPTGVAATDTARLQAALAGGFREIEVESGTALINAPLIVSPNTLITFSPNAILLSSIAPSGPGGFLNSVFYAAAVVSGVATTLSAASVIGSQSISTVGPVAVGQTVSFGIVANNTFQQAVVLATAGAGPFTLTLDDAVQYVFAAGAPVTPITPPSNIIMLGNGAQIIGTGDRAIELASANHCWVENLRIGPNGATAFTTMGASFDVGGRDNWFSDVVVDGGFQAGATPTQIGLALESGVRTGCIRCRVHDVGSSGADAGFLVASSRLWLLDQCDADANAIGINITSSGGTDTLGSALGEVRGGEIIGNVTYGILLTDTSLSTKITGTRCSFNGFSGIRLALSTGLPTDIELLGVICENNGTADTSPTSVDNGITVDGAGIRILGATCKNSVNYGIKIVSNNDVIVTDYVGRDNATGDLEIGGSGRVRVTNLESAITAGAGFWIGIQLLGSGDVWINGANITGVATGTKVGIDATVAGTTARLHTSNVVTFGPMAIGIALGGNGDITKWWRGQGDLYDSCATPIAFSAPASRNYGTIALTNGVGTIPWTGITANNVTPTVNRITTGAGVIGSAFTVTINPGVGVIVTSVNNAGATVVTDDGVFAMYAP